MREIKFRFFDKSESKMLLKSDDKAVTLLGKPMECIGSNDSGEHWDLMYANEIIIMQYTGLKDKNGVEIYEGDYLRIRSFNTYDKNHNLLRDDPTNYNQCGIVEWVEYNASFMVMQRHLGREIVNQWNNSIALQPNEEVNWEMEIIGNVHQHPHLLKD